MKPIDLDHLFHHVLEDWMKRELARGRKVDELEDEATDVYERFCDTPQPALDGLSPRAYFDRMTDGDALVELMLAYHRSGVDLPDLLPTRIVELGKPCVNALLALLRDEEASSDNRVMALHLMQEMACFDAVPDCYRLIDAREEDDELADAAAELLFEMGEAALPALKAHLENASSAAKLTYLDLLCNFSGDPSIYPFVAHEFLNQPDKRALYASYLGKLGDERALEPLRQVLALSDLRYLDFLEIENAIEMLGGDRVSTERDFSGDPDYEALKSL